MTKKIIHIDMDCFYAAIEIRDRPELKTLPLAIGGPSNSRGVICTANYIARSFGVKSAMSCSQAIKKCPHLVLMSPNFYKYKKISTQINTIFSNYSSLIEPLGLDEAYIDVTDNSLFNNSATLIAKQIIADVKEETGLDASAGIAPNKFLAKVASDWMKPNGLFTISPRDIDSFILNLPVSKIPGVGKVTQKKLQSIGILNCYHLQNCNPNFLDKKFGKLGHILIERSFGIDNRAVKKRSLPKSVSCEKTFSKDISKLETKKILILDLIEEMAKRLVSYKESYYQKLRPQKLFLKIKTFDFQIFTCETILPLQVIETLWENELITSELTEEVSKLMNKLDLKDTRPIRLIGLGFRFVPLEEDNNSLQLSFI